LLLRNQDHAIRNPCHCPEIRRFGSKKKPKNSALKL
jgi:hypothetical protein